MIQIQGGIGGKHVAGQHRVLYGLVHHRLSGQRQVGPGRHHHGSNGLDTIRCGRILQVREQGKSQPCARRIAHHDDLPVARVQQTKVRRLRIFQRCRKGVLRRQPVVGDKDRQLRARGKLPCKMPIGLCRAQHIGASMQIEDDRTRCGYRRATPDTFHAAHPPLRVKHTPGGRDGFKYRVVGTARQWADQCAFVRSCL